MKKMWIAQGSTFTIEFAGEESIEADIEKPKPRERSDTQKQAKIGSIKTKSSPTKKSKNQKYPACNIKGHTLPDGYEPSAALVKRVQDKIVKNIELVAEVEKL